MMTYAEVARTQLAKPFVKWAGGKTSLLSELLNRVPPVINTYYEPFVGGGALFYAVRGLSKRAVINDMNEHLMTAYRVVKQDVEGLIKKLQRYPNDIDFFLKMRKKKYDEQDKVSIAARVLYLNRTCFNGLWRVNNSGEFNVPFGHYKKPQICNADNLRDCSNALRGVKIASEDFMYSASDAKKGDFVYFDPPYLPRMDNFTKYTKGAFGLKEHERLRNLALRLKEKGVQILISNSDVEEIRALYKGRNFKIEEVRGARSIGSTEMRRGHMPDLLIS